MAGLAVPAGTLGLALGDGVSRGQAIKAQVALPSQPASLLGIGDLRASYGWMVVLLTEGTGP